MIREGMANRELFRCLIEQQARDAILQRLLEVRGMVLSLATFFEDLKFLEAPAQVLRTLFDIGSGTVPKDSSVYKVATHGFRKLAHEHNGTYEVETSMSSFTSATGPISEAMKFGYWQIWLFAIRNFTHLTSHTPKKENGKPKPSTDNQSEYLWYELAKLAHRLQFKSQFIEGWVATDRDPDFEMAHTFLLRCRPALAVAAAETILRQNAESIADIIRDIPYESEATTESTKELLTAPEEPVKRRYGRPFQQSHDSIKHHLYLPTILTVQNAISNGVLSDGISLTVSPLFVRTVVFSAFFQEVRCNLDPEVPPITSLESQAAPLPSQPERHSYQPQRRPRSPPHIETTSAEPPSHTSANCGVDPDRSIEIAETTERNKRRRVAIPASRFVIFTWENGSMKKDIQTFTTRREAYDYLQGLGKKRIVRCAAGVNQQFLSVDDCLSMIDSETNPSRQFHLFMDAANDTVLAFAAFRNTHEPGEE